MKKLSPAASKKGQWLSFWSGRRELNPRPKRWQRFALPLSYSRLFKKDYKTTIFYKQEFEKSREFRMNYTDTTPKYYFPKANE